LLAGFGGHLQVMGLRRLGLIGAAITFARSERGRRMIQQARAKYDTPQNRAKAKEALTKRTSRTTTGTAPRR
jgi:hypothetical protein